MLLYMCMVQRGHVVIDSTPRTVEQCSEGICTMNMRKIRDLQYILLYTCVQCSVIWAVSECTRTCTYYVVLCVCTCMYSIVKYINTCTCTCMLCFKLDTMTGWVA